MFDEADQDPEAAEIKKYWPGKTIKVIDHTPPPVFRFSTDATWVVGVELASE